MLRARCLSGIQGVVEHGAVLKLPENEGQRPHVFVRAVDSVAVACIRAVIFLATLKSRDASERFGNVFKPDPSQATRIRTWQTFLEWSPQKRAAWFSAVLLGLLLGGLFVWWNLET